MDKTKAVEDLIELGSDNQAQGRYGPYILRPAYQPIYSTREDNVAVLTGYEGLIRPSLDGTAITSEDFFEAIDAEEQLFVERLCMALHIRGYYQTRPKNTDLFINVNVAHYPSVEEVEQEFFHTFSQLVKYGFDKNTVVFEILETEITQPEVLQCLCKMIRNNGYKFALDDFGTNHSNVDRYLAVNPDIIKVDRSLFTSAMATKETERLFETLMRALQENGGAVLMEGVETVQELAFAARMHVDMLQGFYLGMPDTLAAQLPEEIIIPDAKVGDERLRVVGA